MEISFLKKKRMKAGFKEVNIYKSRNDEARKAKRRTDKRVKRRRNKCGKRDGHKQERKGTQGDWQVT